MNPTKDTYERLQRLYDYMNDRLFEGKLPNCLITFQRKNGMLGYFHFSRFENKEAHSTDEIAMNPKYFRTRTDKETASTLVHEMVHLWQYHNGSPSNGYHNKEWADKMESLGLIPSSTGKEGGKRTGQRMSHWVKENGAFDIALKEMDFSIEWKEKELVEVLTKKGKGKEEGKKEYKKNKIKYSCPDCGTNVWGKEGLRIVCGDCDCMFQ